MNYQDLIKILDLKPHPEGGFYGEVFRSKIKIKKEALPERFPGDRIFLTLIYYLLPKGAHSRFHRIKSDEIYHFYLGGPMTVVEIRPDGSLHKTIMGQDLKNEQVIHYKIHRDAWFGAYPNPGTEFSLIGCSVSPGFEFEDFEIAKQEELLKQYPQHEKIIKELADD